jgi:hypothetical protein
VSVAAEETQRSRLVDDLVRRHREGLGASNHEVRAGIRAGQVAAIVNREWTVEIGVPAGPHGCGGSQSQSTELGVSCCRPEQQVLVFSDLPSGGLRQAPVPSVFANMPASRENTIGVIVKWPPAGERQG